ncbi:MAG: N-6 DNA methylase [bacterium]
MTTSSKNRANTREHAKSAAFVWGVARKLLGKRTESAQGLEETLQGIIDASTVASFVSSFPRSNTEVTGRFDDTLTRSYRKSHGVYFTPTGLAERMATWLPAGSGWVVDPTCGDGELLVAAARHGHRVWGVEQDPFAALVAAIRLKAIDADAFIVCGDGLDPDAWPDDVKSSIVNPPYVGEKGNKSLFDDLRTRWPDLTPAFSPRMDLAYLFWWRVIQWSPHAVVLASEYWLWADAAQGVRQEMAKKLPARWLFRLGAGQFSSAPGHHSLVAVCDQR